MSTNKIYFHKPHLYFAFLIAQKIFAIGFSKTLYSNVSFARLSAWCFRIIRLRSLRDVARRQAEPYFMERRRIIVSINFRRCNCRAASKLQPLTSQTNAPICLWQDVCAKIFVKPSWKDGWQVFCIRRKVKKALTVRWAHFLVKHWFLLFSSFLCFPFFFAIYICFNVSKYAHLS